MTTITDNFNRADQGGLGTSGGGWSWSAELVGAGGGANIVSNQAKSTATAQAVFRARKLLGVSAKASREDILLAHRQLVTLVHPDRGGSNSQVHEANAARDLLLDQLPYHSGV